MNRLQLINLVLFQAGWWACVLLGGSPAHWSGTLIAIGIIGFHLSLSDQAHAEAKLIALAILIGLLWDSLLVRFGLLNYSHGMMADTLAPHWIIAIWAIFATTINLSLRWLKNRTIAASLLGAIGAPLSYYAGMKVGSVTMPDQLLAMTVLGLGWALLMPVLMRFSMRYDGFSETFTLRPSAS
jgi:hypothetical protein